MKRMQVCLAFLVLAAVASQAKAQGTVSWDSGYPAGGSTSGSIKTAGTFALDCGWSLVGMGGNIRVWQDGETVMVSSFLMVSCNSWSEMVAGLNAGTSYNVTVEFQVTDGCQTVTISSIPKTASATCFAGGLAASPTGNRLTELTNVVPGATNNNLPRR